MKLELDVNEINFVLQTLGQLPSSTGVWPLIVKIKEQADAQLSAVTDVEEK
jgi:hypothetical protein